MKRILLPASWFAVVILLGGCIATPVGQSGGIGSVLVPDTNVNAIISAAQNVFGQYGYSPGAVDYPQSISFDKPAGGLGNLAYGSYDETTTVRVQLTMVQVPGTNNYKLSTRTLVVNDAGEAGFEDSHRMGLGPLWSAELKPLLRKIGAQAAGAGGG